MDRECRLAKTLRDQPP